MRSIWQRGMVGAVVAVGLCGGALFAAEEVSKSLPTLLIKGEVVSLDANDPAATLLKVKDRYGFETPIFLTQETKVSQGEKTLQVASLTQGTTVEVEYNFDVNTAKRHAVTVKVPAPTQAASAPTQAAAAIPGGVQAPTQPSAAFQATPASPKASADIPSATQEQTPAVQ